MNWNRIREERKKKGYTLAQVARETGYSIGYISQLERNQKEPSLGRSAENRGLPRLFRGLPDYGPGK